MRTTLIVLCGILLSACQDPATRLHALFDREWEYMMRQYPTWASELGDRRYNDRWDDESIAAIERRHAHQQQVLRELEQFDEGGLSEQDRLNLRLFRRQYERQVELHPYGWWLIPLDQRRGIQTANVLSDSLRFQTVKDYEDWCARLESFPAYMEQTMERMRAGMARGIVQPRVVMDRVPSQIRAHIVDDPARSLFYEPFARLPASFTESQRDALSQRAQAAIRQQVLPAYRRFERFFVEEYLPACYEQVGAWQFPNGQEMYAAMARGHTTTNLTPEQIHQIGLEEVRRIRGQMDAIIRQVNFSGTFEQFLHHLRTDPRFYVTDGQELLRRYRALGKEIDPRIVRLFRTLPRMPYGIDPIPAHIAPDTTTAYYQSPAADGSRAGVYFVNIHRPETRPLYEMEALSLHEAVPGHHFQIALAMEQGELPRFRQHGHFTAYVEGWGLYAESLGDELGLYQDPYSKFGQLTYEMWRACRLVIDTGIHHKRWTRQQAIDFMKAHAAKSELDIINEIDRYIAWPGQALAYKIGELKIKELRARAQQSLGDRFDVRDFHDVVLLGGAVPLDVLEENVDAWISEAREAR
jgi:uncharacterized protein (DUF885 family)